MDRIFYINQNLQLLDKQQIRKSIFSNIDTNSPLVLFVDDFTKKDTVECLPILAEIITVLREKTEVYVIATARKDQLSREYSDWFRKLNFLRFETLNLTKSQSRTYLSQLVWCLE